MISAVFIPVSIVLLFIYSSKMLVNIAKLPLPEKFLIMINSANSLGIPKIEKAGEIKPEINKCIPLCIYSSTAIKTATK